MKNPQTFITFGTIQSKEQAPGTPILVPPRYTQIKLWPSCSYCNEDGFLEFFGPARPIVRGPSSVVNFKDTAGSQTAQDGSQVWLSKEYGITAPFRFGPNVINQITNVGTFGTQADLSSNARVRIHFIARNGSGGSVLFKLQAATSDASTIFEESENVAPDTIENSVSILRLYDVPSDGGDKDQFVDVELNFPVRDFQSTFSERTNLLWVTIERQGTSGLDTFPGNVDVVSVSTYFTSWRLGEHISFF